MRLASFPLSHLPISSESSSTNLGVSFRCVKPDGKFVFLNRDKITKNSVLPDPVEASQLNLLFTPTYFECNQFDLPEKNTKLLNALHFIVL